MLDKTLAQWLAGEFDNRKQAMDDPTWYVPLRLWHRPLIYPIRGHCALFAEQANFLDLDRPYRQRIFTIEPSDTQCAIQYWAFQDPQRFRGAGMHPELLLDIQESVLEFLPTCRLTVSFAGNRFEAKPEPDTRCNFYADGQLRQVILGFSVTEDSFWSYDRGVHPETGQSLWGALMGPYQYEKKQSFAALNLA